MANLQFSIHIHAPKEKVWNTMLGETTYPLWTEAFSPGSSYIGSWDEGSEIRFVAPDETGEMGMISRINENRRYAFLSIEHLGLVKNGNADVTSAEAKEWAGTLENYSFREEDGFTHLVVDLAGNIKQEYVQMFEAMWPKALKKLKELAENNQ